MEMDNKVRYLQGWVGVVGLMALGNTVQCFRDHAFLAERLYTGATAEVNGLMARLFGVWTLLAAILRLYCAFDIRNLSLYNMTFISFILAFGHFMLEIWVYGSAQVTPAALSPIAVSGLSVIWMLWGYTVIWKVDEHDNQHLMQKVKKDMKRL